MSEFREQTKDLPDDMQIGVFVETPGSLAWEGGYETYDEFEIMTEKTVFFSRYVANNLKFPFLVF